MLFTMRDALCVSLNENIKGTLSKWLLAWMWLYETIGNATCGYPKDRRHRCRVVRFTWNASTIVSWAIEKCRNSNNLIARRNCSQWSTMLTERASEFSVDDAWLCTKGGIDTQSPLGKRETQRDTGYEQIFPVAIMATQCPNFVRY